ncbi:H-type lectin domain-containing protein [Aerosakkonema sp. BLCC-F183]|uniref:H-type lectin domain-containing protein n=1 Tax=Aerosakkonema sp. BLCC-F183 TaxID=3342834 RepID=UPI0035BA16A4
MATTGADDWKTPLGVYERAIRELTKTRQEMQAELESIKAMQASQIENFKEEIERYQIETQTLKAELGVTKERLNTVQKIADESLSSKEALNEVIRLTKERVLNVEKSAEDVKREIDILKLEPKQQINNLRIEHGVWEGTAQNTPGWSILDGDGSRVFRSYIRFEQGFSQPPQVVVGISYFDIIRKANSRLNVKVAEIDKNGFYFHLQTYLNTQIWAAGVNWLAYGY